MQKELVSVLLQPVRRLVSNARFRASFKRRVAANAYYIMRKHRMTQDDSG